MTGQILVLMPTLRVPQSGLGQFKQAFLIDGQPAMKNSECLQTEEAGGDYAWLDNKVKGKIKSGKKNCDCQSE